MIEYIVIKDEITGKHNFIDKLLLVKKSAIFGRRFKVNTSYVRIS